MPPPDLALHGRSQTDLLRMSRDALRRAAATPGDAVATPTLVGHLGLLSDHLNDVSTALEGVRRELWQRMQAGTISAADGVFAGEPVAALTAMDLWVRRASTSTTVTRQAVENAHTAAAGLAHPARRSPTRRSPRR